MTEPKSSDTPPSASSQPANRAAGFFAAANLGELSALATGRLQSLFAGDLQNKAAELKERIQGRRVLVIGGAGSIGSATVRALTPFRPGALHVVDQSENSLVELVRDFRSRYDPDQLRDFRSVPLNFGSTFMERYLSQEAPYHYVLNFAALKHVRSEKDVCSVLQMLDTNVIQPRRLLRWLARAGTKNYFCVSTDKAANPVNLMGASKRLMEHAIFCDLDPRPKDLRVTSARFANVAYSDGSLLQGWLMRMGQGQPLAAPRDTRRYFVSLEEAGQICLLAAFASPARHVLVPKLDPGKDLIDLAQLAARTLERFGFEPQIFEDEHAARRAAANPDGAKYPLLLTPLDTAGEKAYEEFAGDGERQVELGLEQLAGIPYLPAPATDLKNLFLNLETWTQNPDSPVRLSEVTAEIQKVLPEFHHRASVRTLDQRM